MRYKGRIYFAGYRQITAVFHNPTPDLVLYKYCNIRNSGGDGQCGCTEWSRLPIVGARDKAARYQMWARNYRQSSRMRVFAQIWVRLIGRS